MSSLRYVYGIARASDAARVAAAELTGIDEGPVGCVVAGALLAAASDVDEAVYGEAPLNEHVRDLDWLAARAAQHQVVNGRLLELLGTVLPLAFGAIYRDDDRVRAMLREDTAVDTSDRTSSSRSRRSSGGSRVRAATASVTALVSSSASTSRTRRPGGRSLRTT